MEIFEKVQKAIFFCLILFLFKFTIRFLGEDIKNIYTESVTNSLCAILFYFLQFLPRFKESKHSMNVFLFLNQFILLNVFTLEIDQETEPSTNKDFKKGFYAVMAIHTWFLYVDVTYH